MKKKLLFFLIFPIISFAQVTVNIAGPLSFNGAGFGLLYDAAELQGTLTSIEISATLDASVNETYADDLTIAVTDSNDLGTSNLLLQAGGFSDFGAAEQQPWPNGASEVPGTVVSGTIVLAAPINFTANPDYAVFLGNGYADANPPTNSGTWSNISITLYGVTENTASAESFDNLKLNIYPNPANDVLNITSELATIQTVSVVDLNGRTVKQVELNKTYSQINVSDLNSGVYMLNIQTEEGKTVKKFVKN